MRFDPAKYGPSPVDLGFFDIRGSDVWNGDPRTTFLVFGYPTSLPSVEIDDISGALSRTEGQNDRDGGELYPSLSSLWPSCHKAAAVR